MHLSQQQRKLIRSLAQNKYRENHQLFVAEGSKVVDEFLRSPLKLHQLFCVAGSAYEQVAEAQTISSSELQKISRLKTPNKVLALFEIPPAKALEQSGLILVLDEINDPGNLGTIIRLSDWFGVKQLVCSPRTVDCFNPKVVQASMGSLARVSVVYADLATYLHNTPLPIHAAVMDGSNIYQEDIPASAILVLGNEAHGISEEILAVSDRKVSIPRYGKLQQTESLNVATAAAVLLSEFRRRV